MTAKIDWNYPAPRPGWPGELDKFFGPGTSPLEFWMIGIFSVTSGALLFLYALLAHLDWTAIQYVIATLLAIDIAGGVVTNATPAAKRWYHRAGQGFTAHFMFIAVHLVYIFLVAWLFRSMDWLFMVTWSACLLGATTIILKTPLYLQRSIALGLFAISIPINSYVFSPTRGLEWFIPVLFLKLLVSHLLREEPYQPATE